MIKIIKYESYTDDFTGIKIIENNKVLYDNIGKVIKNNKKQYRISKEISTSLKNSKILTEHEISILINKIYGENYARIN